MSELYRFRLVLGDPNFDGHGKTEIFLIEANRDAENLKRISDIAVNKSGVEFASICEERQDDRILLSILKTFREFGYEGFVAEEGYALRLGNDDISLYREEFVDMFLWWLTLGDPELEIKVVDEIGAPIIFPGLGYGLFF